MVGPHRVEGHFSNAEITACTVRRNKEHMAVQNLMRRAQAAMLGAFDRRDTVTAAQLDAAVPGFSEKTKKRARAGLTRDGILVRGKLGMHGEVTYTLARAASPAYRWPRFSTMRQPGPRMATNDDATLPAERDYADDDDYDYVDDDDETGGYERSGTAGWVVPIGIFACGLAAVVLVRRRFGAFSIGKSDGTARTAQLPPFTSIAPRARQTPVRRQPATHRSSRRARTILQSTAPIRRLMKCGSPLLQLVRTCMRHSPRSPACLAFFPAATPKCTVSMSAK